LADLISTFSEKGYLKMVIIFRRYAGFIPEKTIVAYDFKN